MALPHGFAPLTASVIFASLVACGGEAFTDSYPDASQGTGADGGSPNADRDGASGDDEGDDSSDGDLRMPDADLTADASKLADGSTGGGDGASGGGDAALGDARSDSGAGGVALFGSASTFAVLAGSAITITDATPTTIIGDVGVDPGTSIMTLSAGEPTGKVHAGDSDAVKAQMDLTSAYITLASLPCTALHKNIGDLGGQTLAPATYCFDTSAAISGDLVLDAKNDPNASWIFQIGTTLTTATSATVTVINGGSGCNVQWQLGTSATLGTNTKFAGNIIASESITMVTGSTVFTGRLLARNGFVSLDANTVSAKSCQ